jgi:tetratricopeptide (TPR) repeat protein
MPAQAMAARAEVGNTGKRSHGRGGETAMSDGTPQKGRKKVKVTRRRGTRKLSDEPRGAAKSNGAAARDAKPAGEPAPETETAGDWTEIADRAAKRLRELADEARNGKAAESAKKMAVDLGEGVESAFDRIREQAQDLMSKGQHTRVRIKFRGKQIAELPIAAVAAAEVASFWWFGPLRVVIGHVVGKAILDVEFVSNADAYVAQGKALLADGELEKAMVEFDKAIAMDRRHAGALLGKGIAFKLKGDRASAREWFEKAEAADARSEAGREARRHLDNL